MSGPLTGIKIVDMTTMMSGPLATMLLGDQGADVIKVETPSGELMRKVGRSRNGVTDSFQCSNRSKRSLSVDLKSEQGRSIVKQLLANADVLVQNFRPGTMARLGLDETAVRTLNPGIIYVSINGVGEDGPYARQRIYDPMIQALSGMADIQADNDTGRPRMVRTVLCDQTTALAAAQAVTAALFERANSGKGQHVKLSMLDTMVSFLWPEGMSPLTFVGDEGDPASAQLGGDLVYQTQDGYITAGAVTDAEWSGMCKAIERLDLLADERFKTADGRFSHANVRRAITAEEMKKWTSGVLLERLRDNDVPSAPVLARGDIEQDPQVKHNGVIVIQEDEILGQVRQARPAARFDRTPATPTRMAPRLGADNETILAELGYAATSIEELTRSGILGSPETQSR
ncbi:MAG: CoA transferase [Thiotrichales bacterium]|nr:CoA transferase [Thiotrichales bacterium]